MWLFNWIAGLPVFIIRDNEILPAKDLYRHHLMDSGYFMPTNDETVWGCEWGKREMTELHFPKGMEYEVCELEDFNGLRPLQYNRKTGRYYFICEPSSPKRGGHFLALYQNGEWKELLENIWFETLWCTDAGGNTWLADFAEDSTRLICITADGNIEQQLIEFKKFSPDDRGGCYLLDSDGSLIHYKEKKLTIYPLPGIKNTRNIAAFSDRSVYLQKGNALYLWTPENLRQLMTKDGFPADSAW
ncbi:hypothetical protein FJZ31_04925 [Candidatus Poribacteria bacterium]|nr:hypothetical protein [Candidatus Poribacteria bacterium]